jgi:uncharacterized protein
MAQAGLSLGFEQIAYGMNLDDRADFRPGQQAAAEHGVHAPLAEAGLTKPDIRQLAREAGLQVWDKPASACLSSRLAYGQAVTATALTRVERAEDYLRGLGLSIFRVRDHGGLARIELGPDEMDQLFSREKLGRLAETMKELGFQYVTFDCEGFRSGSMNRQLA